MRAAAAHAGEVQGMVGPDCFAYRTTRLAKKGPKHTGRGFRSKMHASCIPAIGSGSSKNYLIHAMIPSFGTLDLQLLVPVSDYISTSICRVPGKPVYVLVTLIGMPASIASGIPAFLYPGNVSWLKPLIKTLNPKPSSLISATQQQEI